MSLQRVWWALGVLLVVAAIVVCLAPMPEVPGPVDWSDKVFHMIGHAALALYFAGLMPRSQWWKIFVFLLLFGIAIEFAQHFMATGRQADSRDVLANNVGAVLGLTIARLGLSRWPEFAAWLLGRRAVQ